VYLSLSPLLLNAVRAAKNLKSSHDVSLVYGKLEEGETLSAPDHARIFKSRKDSGFRIPEFGFLNLDFDFSNLA
jgi:hypothetical protein